MTTSLWKPPPRRRDNTSGLWQDYAHKPGSIDDVIIELSRQLCKNKDDISFLANTDLLGQNEILGMLESPLHFEGRTQAHLRFGSNINRGGCGAVGIYVPGKFGLFRDDKFPVDYIGIIDTNTLCLKMWAEHSIFYVCRGYRELRAAEQEEWDKERIRQDEAEGSKKSAKRKVRG